MSFSIVKKSLELFKDEETPDKSAVKKKKQVATIHAVDSNAKSRKKERRMMKNKLKRTKRHIATAFDERHKFEIKNCTDSNLQFMRDVSSLKVTDEKTVNKIVEYQAGRLAKNRPKEPVAVKQKVTVFTNKDFDKFEKEYAF